MIEHTKMMQTPYLDIRSMLLSGQVLHRLIEVIKVTCFGISRRSWLCLHCPPIGGKQLPAIADWSFP